MLPPYLHTQKKRKNMTNSNEIAKCHESRSRSSSLLGPEDAQNITAELNVLLADVFALYLKTKNVHWHISGPHFRDYHLLLDEQADQIFAMTDNIAERIRKLGGTTIRSIGHVARLKHVADNDAEYVEPQDMLGELQEDNRGLIARMIEIHDQCDEVNMREYCYRGYRILKSIPFFAECAEIVYSHQEHYDGTGYPRGLKGEQIPFGARLVAVANTSDAITSGGPYRVARSVAEAREEIRLRSGRQFDPEVVSVFLSMPENIWADLRKKIDD